MFETMMVKSTLERFKNALIVKQMVEMSIVK